jgi:hypothetical protein
MEAKTRKKYNPLGWNWKRAGEIVHEYAETSLVLLFIANGLATMLILFNQVEANDFQKQVVGSIAFAFSLVAFVRFTNQGVKHQLTNNKKGKK